MRVASITRNEDAVDTLGVLHRELVRHPLADLIRRPPIHRTVLLRPDVVRFECIRSMLEDALKRNPGSARLCALLRVAIIPSLNLIFRNLNI